MPLEDLDQEQVDSRDFKVNALWSKLNFGSINMVNTFFYIRPVQEKQNSNWQYPFKKIKNEIGIFHIPIV